MAAVTGILHPSNEAATVPIQTGRKLGRTDVIWNKWRSHASLMYMLRKMSKKAPTNTNKFYAWHSGEKTQSGTLTGCDAAGTAAAITTSLVTVKSVLPGTDCRQFWQVGDQVGLRYDQSANTNYTSNPDIGMEICSVAAINVVGTNVVATLVRGVGKAAATTNVTVGSGSSLEWVSMANFNKMGGDARDPIMDTPSEDYQVCQRIREDYGYAGSFNTTDLYWDEEARQAKVQLDKFFNDLDRSTWMNTLKVDWSGGDDASKMGGFIPFLNNQWATTADATIAAWSTTTDLLTGTGTSRITRVNGVLTLNKLYDFYKSADDWGEPENKKTFVDFGLATEIMKVLEGKVRLTPESKKFGLKIFEFDNPSLDTTFIRCKTFKDIMPYTGVVVDFENIRYRYMVTKKKAGNYLSGNRDVKVVPAPGTTKDRDMQTIFFEGAIQPLVKASHSMITKVVANT